MDQRHRRFLLIGLPLLVGLLFAGQAIGLAHNQSYDKADVVTVTQLDSSAFESGQVGEAILKQVDQWAGSLNASDMSESELVKNIDVLRSAIRELPQDDSWWWSFKELTARQTKLCLYLPPDNPYVGEYC
jgi:hypothetical protein